MRRLRDWDLAAPRIPVFPYPRMPISSTPASGNGILPRSMNDFKPVPLKATIPFDVLDKIDVRVGTITAVTDVPKSDKLVRLTVSFGDHQRTILVGMKKERENPKGIEGRQALFVVNLAPRRMMGEESQGMLFDIGHADGLAAVLAVPEDAVPDGAQAG